MELGEYLLDCSNVEISERERADDDIEALFLRKVLNGACEEGDVLLVGDEVRVRRKPLFQGLHEPRVDLAQGELVSWDHIPKDSYSHRARPRPKLEYPLRCSYLS